MEQRTKLTTEFAQKLPLELAFPEFEYPPTVGFEPCPHCFVACPVAHQLWPPEFLPRLGHSCQTACWIGVLVPEAAVYHDGHALFAKHDIRPTGQVLGMEPIAEPSGMKRSANDPLRLGVTPLDEAHSRAALGVSALSRPRHPPLPRWGRPRPRWGCPQSRYRLRHPGGRPRAFPPEGRHDSGEAARAPVWP